MDKAYHRAAWLQEIREIEDPVARWAEIRRWMEAHCVDASNDQFIEAAAIADDCRKVLQPEAAV